MHRLGLLHHLLLSVFVCMISIRVLDAVGIVRLTRRYISMSSSSSSGTKTAPFLSPDARNQVIILAGATSVGKSAVARQLCASLGNCEIVLADSVQVYKHLDIGSNKPTAEELAETKHHMVNVCDPHDNFSCGDYVNHAAPIIYDILNRGKIPVVVGGSTMWLQWLVHGVPDAPKADASTVAEAAALLQNSIEGADWDAAVEIVSQYDSVRVAKLGRNDWYRIQRYLEVALSLRKLQQQQQLEEPLSSPGQTESNSAAKEDALLQGGRQAVLPDLDARCFFLSESRESLYRYIDSRCQDMLRGGLIEEVANLLLTERLTPAAKPARAIGYRQTIEYFLRIQENQSSVTGEVDLSVRQFDKYLLSFASATRNYAKRQLQWYRKDSCFLWLKIDRPDPLSHSSDTAPYTQIAREILHWCTLPQSNFRQTIKQQKERGTAASALRFRKYHGHRMIIRNDEAEWLALAALVENGELQRPKLHDEMSPEEVADSWVSRLALWMEGTKPEAAKRAPFSKLRVMDDWEQTMSQSTPPRRQLSILPKWSAEDVLIRMTEESHSAQRLYRNRFELNNSVLSGAAKSKVGSASADASLTSMDMNFDEVIRIAGECAQQLSLRHPALIEEFLNAWRESPEKESDE